MAHRLQSSVTLDCLPDNLLLHIFSFTDPITLCILSRVNRRVKSLANDHTLWQHVDLSFRPLNISALWKILRAHLPSSLISFTICGHKRECERTPKWKTESITIIFLQQLHSQCPNLKIFKVMDMYISSKLTINAFPSSILQLKLHNCEFGNHSGFFHTTSGNSCLPGLRTLDISYCTGFPGTVLHQIASWKSLEQLRLESCFRITDNNVHYLCKELKHLCELDIRGTSTGDISLQMLRTHQKDLVKLWVGAGGRNKQITNSGVFALHGLRKSLTLLDLTNSDLTNDGLEYLLKNFTKLQTLIIRGSKVTEGVIELWKTKLPSNLVIHYV